MSARFERVDGQPTGGIRVCHALLERGPTSQRLVLGVDGDQSDLSYVVGALVAEVLSTQRESVSNARPDVVVGFDQGAPSLANLGVMLLSTFERGLLGLLELDCVDARRKLSRKLTASSVQGRLGLAMPGEIGGEALVRDLLAEACHGGRVMPLQTLRHLRHSEPAAGQPCPVH